MAAFETFIGLLLASVILAAAARRVGAPYPAFLALGGTVLAFVPGVPTIVLEPDLALALFVAPVLQFIGTFGVWLLAEQIGLSGVLTVVAFAITAPRRAPEFIPACLRLPSYAVWETVVFVLNVLAFVLIGLQIRPILEGLAPAVRNQYLYVSSAVLLTVIVVRIIWVMTYNTVVRLRIRRYGFQPPRPMLAPSVQGGLIISWCGMRGVVSLAAALALPTAFPFRDLIVLTAFCVVLGTLIVQGLTLKPLLRAVDLHDDDPVGREVELARRAALQAALQSVDQERSAVAEVIRQEWTHLLRTDSDQSDSAHGTPAHTETFERALAAARQRLLELRRTDEIGDAAFQRLEEELDWIEMSGARR